MPAYQSKSLRKSKTKVNRYISSNSLPSSHSRRTMIRIATTYDALASQKENHISRVLKELELKKGKISTSLKELLRQSCNSLIHDVNDDFDYDDFGDDSFSDFDNEEMNHDHESE